MDSPNQKLHNLAEALGRSRDELHNELVLTRDEIVDEWNGLEAQWSRFSKKFEQWTDEAEDAGDDVRTALLQLGEQLMENYEHLRRSK